MKTVIQKWLKFAEADLAAAAYLFGKPRANQWTYLLVVWHCHQSIEKLLKAILVYRGRELLYIHDLPRLLTMSGAPNLGETQRDFIFELNQYYLAPRYPDLPLQKSRPMIDGRKVREILIKTKDLFVCLKKNLN